MNENMNHNIIKAAKWSGITELLAKIIQPVTNMVLARVLAPEAFGLVAVITMVISFANMFSDAGFQRYLIQHEFSTKEEKYNSAMVAFWTNLSISIFLWLLIIIFCRPIASILGHPGLGYGIAAAGISLPLTSFSTIQTALYQRDFNFKTLFLARIIGVCIPIFITIPLALAGFHYWALILGTICGNLWNAVILTVKSDWKIKFFYKFTLLKEMIYFSTWSLIEAVSIWITSWADIVIIGKAFNDYYLGIYTNSITMVNALLNVITSATTPILLSALSRLQNNEKEYNRVFFQFQRIVSMILLPMGAGLFIFRDLATGIMFGDQWREAAFLIGLWGLVSTILIVFSDYGSVIFVSKGMPKISFLSQILYLGLLLPALAISSRYSFQTVIYVRVLVRLGGLLINLIFLKIYIRITPINMIKNVFPAIISSILMGGAAYLLRSFSGNVSWQFVSILICILIYFSISLLFPGNRRILCGLAKQLKIINIHKINK